MKAEDVNIMLSYFPKWKVNTNNIKKIGILSSGHEEIQILSSLFPNVTIKNVARNVWDLNNEGSENFDLILACNVFLCSPDPKLWFKNVLNRCRYFWLQDLIRAWRRDDSECGGLSGEDNDIMRYQMPPNYLARVDFAYDLRNLKDETIDFVPYASGGRPDKDTLGFLMFLKGKLI